MLFNAAACTKHTHTVVPVLPNLIQAVLVCEAAHYAIATPGRRVDTLFCLVQGFVAPGIRHHES